MAVPSPAADCTTVPFSGAGIFIGRGAPTNTRANGTGGSGDALVENGGLIDAYGGIFVGGNGVSGALTINGGVVQVDVGVAPITPVVIGGATVENGTTFTGSGLLAIGAGGILSVHELNPGAYGVEIADSGNGQATVEGTGALLDAGPDGLSIANGTGSSGTLTIGAGGRVLVSGSNPMRSMAGLSVAQQGTGTVTVKSGGSLEVEGTILLGRAGIGTLSVASGGNVSQTDRNAKIFVGVGGSGPAGYYYDGTGSVTVAAGGTLTDAGALVVGIGPSSAAMVVKGELDVSGGVTVGNVASFAVGATLITATGTTAATAGTFVSRQTGMPDVISTDPGLAGEIVSSNGELDIGGTLNLLGSAR